MFKLLLSNNLKKKSKILTQVLEEYALKKFAHKNGLNKLKQKICIYFKYVPICINFLFFKIKKINGKVKTNILWLR